MMKRDENDEKFIIFTMFHHFHHFHHLFIMFHHFHHLWSFFHHFHHVHHFHHFHQVLHYFGFRERCLATRQKKKRRAGNFYANARMRNFISAPSAHFVSCAMVWAAKAKVSGPSPACGFFAQMC